MKNIYLYLSLLLATIIVSCNKEPMFPDPGFDNKHGVIDTVRIDTMSVYSITMKMDVPNGVQKIELLDAYKYDLIEDLTAKYAGQKNFIFKYDIDISKITEDTKYSYIVRVVDNNNRAVSRSVSLVVKPLSKPIVYFSTKGESLYVVSNMFSLNARFETGLYKIKSYKVIFNNNVIDSGVLESNGVTTYDYTLNFNQSMELNKPYDLSIELTDERDIMLANNIKLELVKAKKPTYIIRRNQNKSSGEYKLFYREDGLLDYVEKKETSIGYVEGLPVPIIRLMKITFEYNEDNKLIRYCEQRTDIDANPSYNAVYIYEKGVISEIKDNPNSTSNHNVLVASTDENGLITSFRLGSNPALHKNIAYYKAPDGKLYNATLWGSNKSEAFREINVGIVPVEIPTFIPSMPTLCPKSIVPQDIEDLFMYKFVSLSTERINPDKPYFRYRRSYTQDKTGQLTKLVINQLQGTAYKFDREYTFIYE